MTDHSQGVVGGASAQPDCETAPRIRLTPQERVPLILDAAMHEFARRGFAGTRMDDIAARCGLSKGGLYAHFKSKDAIFEALLDRTLQRIDWGQMPQLAAGASASTDDGIYCTTLVWRAWLQSGADLEVVFTEVELPILGGRYLLPSSLSRSSRLRALTPLLPTR